MMIVMMVAMIVVMIVVMIGDACSGLFTNSD
jgi:hypothetical protein